MAISLVGTTKGSAANGANVDIDLTGLSLAQNDLVVVMGGFSNAGNSGVSTSGYTEPVDIGDTVTMSLSVAYKLMGASPDTSVTCLGSGDTLDATSYVVMAFRGVDTSSPLDATSVAAAGVSGAVNSPSITTVTDGAAVISCGIQTASDSTVTPPSGYGNAVVQNQSDSFSCTAMAAWKQISPAGAENPAAWADIASSTWVAASVALRPSSAGTIEDGVLSATGTATASFDDGTLKVFAATGTGTASFVGAPFVDGPLSATGTGTATWDGISFATSGAFSITASGTLSAVGGLSGGGGMDATGTGTAAFIGDSINDASFAFNGVTATATLVGAGSDDILANVIIEVESRGATRVSIG